MAGAAISGETFLGLDIGTSSVKALLVDASQNVMGEETADLQVSRPHPLWSEQNPEDWVNGVHGAVAAIRASSKDSQATFRLPAEERPVRLSATIS